MSKNEPRFMVGSTGGNDYLILGTHKGLDIGVKPVYEDLKHPLAEAMGIEKTVVGFRLRVMEKDPGSIVNVGSMAVATFPQFSFQKVEVHRASAYLLSVIETPNGSMTFDQFFDDMKEHKFTDKLREFVQPAFDVLGESAEVNLEELMTYTVTVFEEMYPQDNKPEGTSPSGNSTGGKILSFPTDKTLN